MPLNRREFTIGALGAVTASGLASAGTTAGKLLHRPIPSSGEMIPVMGLGTNRYSVDESAQARAPLKATLARFHALGGGMIDTAPMYRRSEAVLGDLLGELGIYDEIFMATKTDRDAEAETRPQMERSLVRLKSDNVDLMQIHNLKGWKHTIPMLNEWKKEGRIRYTGITTSRSRQYDELETILKAHDLDFLQINYSLEQRESAERLLPLAEDRGVAVIINRAFGGGRIFDAVGDTALPDWATEFGCESWAQFLLKYALSHPATTVVIPGMTKARYVDDNFHAAMTRMPDAAERKLMEAFYDAL
ncbi:MAG: aldo/keto reductase [Pseudomonadota bacterium]